MTDVRMACAVGILLSCPQGCPLARSIGCPRLGMEAWRRLYSVPRPGRSRLPFQQEQTSVYLTFQAFIVRARSRPSPGARVSSPSTSPQQ
mgnify:CR=1 FL=1